MSEKVDVKLGGKSAEEVAYELMQLIFRVEEKPALTRKEILQTYIDCSNAVRYATLPESN